VGGKARKANGQVLSFHNFQSNVENTAHNTRLGPRLLILGVPPVTCPVLPGEPKMADRYDSYQAERIECG